MESILSNGSAVRVVITDGLVLNITTNTWPHRCTRTKCVPTILNYRKSNCFGTITQSIKGIASYFNPNKH
eukprot:scaffold321060_cov129-Cyclotella_meneghiniana.AAC.1